MGAEVVQRRTGLREDTDPSFRFWERCLLRRHDLTVRAGVLARLRQRKLVEYEEQVTWFLASMRRALDAAQSARDTDGPTAGAGVIAYPLANQVRMIGTAYLWSGDNAKARTELESALRLLARDYVSVAHIAATRADLALARLRDGDLDGAADTLEPLLTLTSSSGYLAGAARRAEKLVEALGSARYTGSAVARRLVVQIEEFVAAQQTNGEAARTGATSERRLPE